MFVVVFERFLSFEKVAFERCFRFSRVAFVCKQSFLYNIYALMFLCALASSLVFI